jgi:SAM-dependent methyltransferase
MNGYPIFQEAAQQLVTHLETAFTPPFPDDEQVWYPYQPSAVVEFYDSIDRVRRLLGEGRYRFLDVGSGIGSKLFLADILGFEAEGIERYAPYVEVSLSLYPKLRATCVNAEEFTAYADFDVVHCNGLALDLEHQQQINRLIMGRMRPGALYWFSSDPAPDWSEPVADRIWRV